MATDSLFLRLLSTSALWVIATLALTGILLVFLFRQHVEQRFDLDSREHLQELVALSEWDPEQGFSLGRPLFDPRFERPGSGWYWQVWRNGEPVAQSPSLWYQRLAVHLPMERGGEVIQEIAGPGGEGLRVLTRGIGLPGSEVPLVYTVSGPRAEIERYVGTFAWQLSLTLTVLGLGLIGAMWVQVRYGLGPLRQLSQALARIRAGQADRLPESCPREVRPVVTELNGLLEHNGALLSRARAQAGDLAHALQNPMTVIRHQAQDLDGEAGAILKEQVARMGNQIDRYLSQARVAGAGGLGARSGVAEAVAALRDTLLLLYRDRELRFQVQDVTGLQFRGDAQDLEEMLGNLMDNACKWARRDIRVGGSRDGERLCLWVEDDGPGIPEQAREQVLGRGRRLDEQVPGSGLGLAIVRNIAELYRGGVRLSQASLGGLRAELDLPALP